jgi:hypothetical protein
MSGPSTPAQELPAELAERLLRLADSQTATSRPWPGVDRALRRSHQRRRAAGSGTAVLCVLVIAAMFSSLNPLTRASHSTPPAGPTPSALSVPTPVQVPTDLPTPAGPASAELGYDRLHTGTLAKDQAWLRQVRLRLAELANHPSGRETVTLVPLLGSADGVLVPWTSELDGVRYALVMYPASVTPAPTGKWPDYSAALLSGPVAGSGDRLSTLAAATVGVDVSYTPAITLLARTSVTAEYPDLAVVLAPAASGVQVATGRHFGPDGSAGTSWRDVPRSAGGAVWVTRLSRAEGYLSQVRFPNNQPTALFGVAGLHPEDDEAASVAAPGTDLKALTLATSSVSAFEPSLAERPVFSVSSQLSATDTLAATVFRTGGNGLALLGIAERSSDGHGAETGASYALGLLTSEKLGDPATFMAALEVPATKQPDTGYLVIAPTAATNVAIGDVTVPVHNRLARFSKSAVTHPGVPVEVRALNPQGAVIATARSTNGH